MEVVKRSRRCLAETLATVRCCGWAGLAVLVGLFAGARGTAVLGPNQHRCSIDAVIAASMLHRCGCWTRAVLPLRPSAGRRHLRRPPPRAAATSADLRRPH